MTIAEFIQVEVYKYNYAAHSYDLGQHRIITTYKQNHPAKC